MDSCDVLIVGGGPAGSALARKLSRNGLDALILDKATFPRDKVCAGWITPAALDLLEVDRAAYARSRVLQEFTGFRTALIGRREILTRYDTPISYGIRRAEFDHYLLGRSGARLRLGEPLRSLERKNGSWIANGTIRAPLVVGAGGHFCPVARFLRGNTRGAAVVAAQEAEFEMDEMQQHDCTVRADTPELYFCADLKGYGWLVRKGNFLNIGLGREDGGDFRGTMTAFLDFLQGKRTIPAGTRERMKGHAYLLYRGVRQGVIDDNVVLIGDAAGLAHPKSGEGIRPAVESALLAADAILACNRDYRRSRLMQYPAALVGRFGRGHDAAGILAQRLKRLLAGPLLESPWFSRRVLLDRWFLGR